jgi:soluble lytic murein transglycosylase-like protein
MLACLAAAAWHLRPFFMDGYSQELCAVGVFRVSTIESDRIDTVLQRRAPGWGIRLRAQVAQAISEEAARTGIDPLLIVALIAVESEFQQEAVSVMGARGLMQFRPSTLAFMAQKEGLRLTPSEIHNDPSLQVRLGVRYLKLLKDQFRGEIDSALMAYNAGPNRFEAAVRSNTSDQYLSYVRAVRRKFAQLKRDHGGVTAGVFAAQR